MSPPAAADPLAAAAAPIPATVSPGLTEPSTRERFRGLLWLVAAAFFMQALDSTVVNTAVPAMAVALKVTPQGIGGASLMPVGRYVLVRSIDKREFVRAMSTVATFGLLGSVLGPLLGGAL